MAATSADYFHRVPIRTDNQIIIQNTHGMPSAKFDCDKVNLKLSAWIMWLDYDHHMVILIISMDHHHVWLLFG